MFLDIGLVFKFSFSWLGTHGYPSYKKGPRMGPNLACLIFGLFRTFFPSKIFWDPVGTHGYPSPNLHENEILNTISMSRNIVYYLHFSVKLTEKKFY